jgi:hypothetical protein
MNRLEKCLKFAMIGFIVAAASVILDLWIRNDTLSWGQKGPMTQAATGVFGNAAVFDLVRLLERIRLLGVLLAIYMLILSLKPDNHESYGQSSQRMKRPKEFSAEQYLRNRQANPFA